MQVEDARYLKRKIKPGAIDAHPTEKALVVNYELEASILGEMGDPLLGDKKECQKIIRLKSLNSTTNVSALAREVVDKCKGLIHPAKIGEVEQLLFYLQNRRDTPPGSAHQKDGDLRRSELGERIRDDPDFFSDSGGGVVAATTEDGEEEEAAHITRLDSYVELLYEDVAGKVRGTALIMRLARNPDNLEELMSNETILGALARVLREDWKKSTELATNIIYTFFCFSHYSQFHNVIAHFKVGAMCVAAIEHELKRHDLWRDELLKKRKLEGDNHVARKEYDHSLKKYQCLVTKQEQLLRVAFYILLNLAEDIKLEMKMVNKNVVGMLVKSLERDGVELLLLAVTFLKKLSVFVENKNQMADLNVVEKVSKLVPCENPDLLNATLRLLLNLSFDSELRGKMIKVGLLPKLVSLIHSKHRVIVLSILYHISMDDRCKSLFTYTDCIPIVMKLVMDCEEEHAEIELLALCANLAANRRNAQLMCEAGGGLRLLMRRAFRFKDCLLMKVVRSVAQHDGPTRNLFVEYVSDLANAVVRCDSEDFIIEVLGCLANLVIADLDYELLLREYELVPWLRERLRPGAVDDDLIMECVLLVSTCCSDDQCATMLANEGFVTALVDLLHAKQEDDEFVCQLMHCCYRLVRHPQTRARVLRTHAPDYMLDLMFDPNPVVRSVVNDTLEIIAEHDDTWAKKIQSERFRHHNENWLDMVESRQAEDTAHDMYGEDEIGPYLQEGMLDRPDLFYGEGHDSVTLQGDGNLSPDYVVDEVFSNGGAAEFLGHHAYPRSEFEVDDQYDRPMNPFGQPTVPGYGVSNLEGSFVDRF